MSWRATRRLWNIELPTSQKVVLMCLADMADSRGICWPSVAYIGKRTGLCDRTIQNALKMLSDAELIECVAMPGRSNTYRVDPRNNCATQPPQPLRGPAQSLRTTPAKFAPKSNHEPEKETAGVIRARKTVGIGEQLRGSELPAVQAALRAV